mmetsp:Transcript_45752/g.126954  ORF Transcript_45752/g.126954 Transcript_45752/m.126954 type:complete len:334 (+) Transcript_45752:98-1099(+)
MGKKPAAKSKAKAKAAPEPEKEDEAESAEKLEAKRIWQQRREASKWAQSQLDAIRGQVEAAAKKGNCDWLQVTHEFHEVRLIKLAKRLAEKTLDGVPDELRSGIEAYLSQFAGGKEVTQEGLCEHREAWDALEPEGGAAYARAAETPEAVAAAEQLRAWSDASEAGVQKFADVLRAHSASPGVQEAGLTRIGGLLAEAREGSAAGGLTSPALMPLIDSAMRGHLRDPDVQRSGCAALRGLALADAQLPHLCDAGGVHLAVEAVKEHFKSKEVALAGNGAFWAMAKSAGRNSPELSAMRTGGVVEVLMKVMTHHAWDQTLCGKVRVTLPFITED